MNDRLAAAQWARDILSKNPVILDTETTGLDDGEICQIAIIDASGQTLLDTLVKPSRPIPMGATRIHGITDLMVAEAPLWGMVGVLPLIHDRDVVIYNRDYDMRMLRQSDAANGLSSVHYPNLATWHCAMLQYAAYHGDWGFGVKLS